MTSEELKKWLFDYREQRREFEQMVDRLEELEAMAGSPSSPVLDGMLHNGSHSPDRIGLIVAQLEEMRAATATLAEDLRQRRHEIEAILKRLTGKGSADKKAVIRSRYIDGGSWQDVTFLLFGGKTDFVGKEDTYLRRVHKIHAAAVAELAEHLPSPDFEGQENEEMRK